MPTTQPIDIQGRRLSFRLAGHMSFDQGLRQICEALELAIERKCNEALVSATEVTGIRSISTAERIILGERLAALCGGKMTLALVARHHLLDPGRLGQLIAQTKGLHCEIFTSETEAIKWLDSSICH